MRTRRAAWLILPLALVLGAAGCSDKKSPDMREADPHTRVPSAESTGAILQGDSVQVGPLKTVLPAEWSVVQPATRMRRAEFRLAPASEDVDAGELTVFYFGPQAGTVQMNIERWIQQFKRPSGEPMTEDLVEKGSFEAGDMKVNTVMFTGTQKSFNMPGAPQTPERENWMNLSGIISTPEGPWFFKGTGPEETMRLHMEAFNRFLRSMRYTGSQQ